MELKLTRDACAILDLALAAVLTQGGINGSGWLALCNGNAHNSELFANIAESDGLVVITRTEAGILHMVPTPMLSNKMGKGGYTNDFDANEKEVANKNHNRISTYASLGALLVSVLALTHTVYNSGASSEVTKLKVETTSLKQQVYSLNASIDSLKYASRRATRQSSSKGH